MPVGVSEDVVRLDRDRVFLQLSCSRQVKKMRRGGGMTRIRRDLWLETGEVSARGERELFRGLHKERAVVTVIQAVLSQQ